MFYFLTIIVLKITFIINKKYLQLVNTIYLDDAHVLFSQQVQPENFSENAQFDPESRLNANAKSDIAETTRSDLVEKLIETTNNQPICRIRNSGNRTETIKCFKDSGAIMPE